MSVVYEKLLTLLIFASMTVLLTFYAGKDRVRISERRRVCLFCLAVCAATQCLIGAMGYYGLAAEPAPAQTLLLLATLAIFLGTLLGGPVRQKIKHSLARTLARLRLGKRG